MEAYGENFNIKIPENIVEECSHVGECYYDCLDNISRVKFPSREIIISEFDNESVSLGAAGLVLENIFNRKFH